MKKAKEYAARIVDKWNSDPSQAEEVIREVAQEMFEEISEIKEARKVNSVLGFRGVLGEIFTKWDAMCNRVNKQVGEDILAPGGFRKMCQNIIPETETVMKGKPDFFDILRSMIREKRSN